MLYTKHAAVNSSIIIAHTNSVHFRTSFDQAAEQADAMGNDHTNEFENGDIVQSINQLQQQMTEWKSTYEELLATQ